MLIVYSATIFLSALLLFLVQPMVGRMVLPVLGGTPAVWNTCMVFFQVLLLVGYGYAHVITRYLGSRAQTAVHCIAAALAVLTLPIVLSEGISVPTGDYPITWLLGVLGAMAGVPFLALSANGPLLQRWFSATDHPRAANPYFLYAASNTGSLIALLGYPVIVEPLLTLKVQSRMWSWGYGALVLLLVGCAVFRVMRERKASPAPKAAASGKPAAVPAAAPITWKTRAIWVLLAFAPSSLMIGSTTFLSTDLAPVPLLWVVPLAVYLVTMIIAFSRLGPGATRLATAALPLTVMVVAATMLMEAREPIGALVALHLALLFIAAMACHGRLSMMRPEPTHLTEYFLLMSLGGALGGMFNAIAAPLVFDRLLEYPIAITVCCGLALATAAAGGARAAAWWSRKPAPAALVPVGVGGLVLASCLYIVLEASEAMKGMMLIELALAAGCALVMIAVGRRTDDDSAWRRWTLNVVVPLSIGALFLCLRGAGVLLGLWGTRAGELLAVGLPALAACLLVRWPARFTAAAACLLGLAAYNQGHAGTTVLAGRSFFGVHRVVLTPSGAFYEFVHGSTQHGAQAREESKRRTPITYFHPTGPVGDIFRLLNKEGRIHRVGVVGLGTGAMAAYAEPGQEFTFYEIDPAIVRVARDRGFFTYLSDARGTLRYEIGDGRLLLARATDEKFDLIVIDAFNSDSIPMHLLTVEAMRMYMERLTEHGVLLVQATNRHLALPLVIVGDADALGLAARGKIDTPTEEQVHEGKFRSRWVAVARTPEDLAFLDSAPGWITLFAVPGKTKVWTDDFSNILGVMEGLAGN